MKRIHASYFVLCVVAFALAACSGPSHYTGGGGGGGGSNATVTLMLTAQPEAPATSHATLSIATTISGITLNPASGNPVNVTLNPASYPVEFLGTQSGDAFLGTVSVPAETYSSVTVTFNAINVTLFNSSGGAINTTCLNNTICKISLAAGSVQIPISVTLTGGQQTGLALRVLLGNLLSLSNGALSVNYSAQNAFKTVALPRPGTVTSASVLDTVENFTGKITAISSSSITVTSGFGVSLTATGVSNATVNDPQTVCSSGANLSCLGLSQIVSIDADLNQDGTLSLTEADLLYTNTTLQDELEGTLFFTNSNSYSLVVLNKIVGSDNALANVSLGDVETLTLSNPSFSIDSEDIPPSQFPALSNFFQSTANFYSGQDLMVHVTSLANNVATADQVRLRFSNFSASVAVAPSGELFSVTASTLAPSIFLQQFSNVSQPSVLAFQNATLVDGVSALSSVAVPDPVSLRALLFLPSAQYPFYAAKVRDISGE